MGILSGTHDEKETGIQRLNDKNPNTRERSISAGGPSANGTAGLDLPVELQGILDNARRLTQARYGVLAVFGPSGETEHFITSGMAARTRGRIGSAPASEGVSGLLKDISGPLNLADLQAHPGFSGLPPHHPKMTSFLGSLIVIDGDPVGNFYVGEKGKREEFSPDDETLFGLLCTQAGMAIRNSRLAQTLEAGQTRLQALIETSPVGIIVVDGSDWSTTLVNKEMDRISSGYSISLDDSSEDGEQSVVFRRPDGAEYSKQDRPLHRALKNGETTRAEEVLFDLPNGKTIPTLVNATPVYSEDRQVTGAIAAVQDMTPLEEVEKLRSEFLGIVGHELRTPLTAIKGSAATVLGSRRPISTEEYTEFFSIIDEQSDRLRDLVDNLLDMTRIEAGSLAVTPEPIALSEVIEEAQGNFVGSGGDQEFLVSLPEGLPLVNGDRSRIGQVIANLFSNAVKFSPGTEPITVDVEFDNVHATVCVQDQGRGISQDQIIQLFRKFSRVHDDGARNLAGSGLGLAISKGIVEAHGGRIWAESPGPGRGSTFSFTLPLARVQAVESSLDITKRADHLGRVRRPGERSRVLVVDDEIQVLRFLERTLDHAGYQSVTTNEPEHVLDLLDQEEPDLVLLDVTLSGADGFDLLEHIREVSGVPVMILTAKDDDEDMVRALRMGADDYITKPFSTSELLARIEVALRRRLMPDQIEVRPPFLLDDLLLDFTHRLVTVEGEAISLTATEYKVLYELANHAGMVMTHGQILQRVWGPDYGGETELVRSFIRNLRRKLGDDARNPKYIFTEPQVGYRMPKP